MATLPFSIVDVFSTTPFKGNPLAIVDNTSDTLSDTQMKLISRQFNLSETTFFLKARDSSTADFRLRSFLPDGKEVFGAGHNILGVWWYLAAEGKLSFGEPATVHGDGTEEFVFRQELGDNISSVTILQKTNGDGKHEFSVSIRQAPPQAHAVHPDVAALAKSIGLSAEDIGFKASSGAMLKPQVMSTSTTRHLMVPVSSTEALSRVEVQKDKLLAQLAVVDQESYGIYLFTPIGEQGAYQARFFSPGMSGEDPATGSAAGPLSRYLHLHGHLELVDGKGSITVEQGAWTGRHCVIQVILSVDGENADVDVVGSGVGAIDGRVRIPDTNIPF